MQVGEKRTVRHKRRLFTLADGDTRRLLPRTSSSSTSKVGRGILAGHPKRALYPRGGGGQGTHSKRGGDDAPTRGRSRGSPRTPTTSSSSTSLWLSAASALFFFLLLLLLSPPLSLSLPPFSTGAGDTRGAGEGGRGGPERGRSGESGRPPAQNGGAARRFT